MILIIVVVFALVFIVLVKLQMHKACAYILLILPYVIAFTGGGWVVGAAYKPIAPYCVFGIGRVLEEKISLVTSHDGVLEFSNGEKINENKARLFRITLGLFFLIAGAVILIALRPSIFYMTKKVSPPIYEHLITFCWAVK